MKFFIPHARDEAGSEVVLASIRRFLASQGYPTTDRRIRRLAFTHDGEAFDLEVGGHHPGMEDDPELTDEPEHPVMRCLVVAILEGSTLPVYYLCMPFRGVIRGYPWLVGFNSVTAAEDFEP
jgi:hypothetical protein